MMRNQIISGKQLKIKNLEITISKFEEYNCEFCIVNYEL